MFDFSGKTVLVTGGAQGIGKETVKGVVAGGGHAVILDINEEVGKATAAEVGNCSFYKIDLGSSENIRAVMAQVLADFDRVDVLINVGGVISKAPFEEISDAEWERTLRINLTGTFMFCQEAARQMIKQNATNGKKGGKIIITASVGGFIGGKGVVGYGASKAGCLSLARTLANNFGRENITVNCICPGYVVTPLNEEFFIDKDGNPTDYYKQQSKATSVRRLGTIEEIAGPVLAMCSDSFNYMTGTYLLCDGGQSIPAE